MNKTAKNKHIELLLGSAEESLKKNPLDSLNRCTSYNGYGGFTYWDDVVWKIYLNPQNIDEWIQKARLQDLLKRAIKNNFAILQIKNQARKKEVAESLSIKDGALDVLFTLFQIFKCILMLSEKNPIASMPFKRNLLIILENTYHLTLDELVREHLSKVAYVNDDWKNVW